MIYMGPYSLAFFDWFKSKHEAYKRQYLSLLGAQQSTRPIDVSDMAGLTPQDLPFIRRLERVIQLQAEIIGIFSGLRRGPMDDRDVEPHDPVQTEDKSNV